MKITINLPKAKLIAHDQRRNMRAAEFAPLDEIIAKQIPGKDAATAEANRQEIRDRYTAMQADIDAATSPEDLKTILETN
jgi:hypothetical protein